MPPGVTWGPLPGATIPAKRTVGAPVVRPVSSSSGPSASEPYEPPTAAAGVTPPVDPGLPNDNYEPTPKVGEDFVEGIASWYGPREQGQATTSGELFDWHQMTAANRMLPFGTIVKVTAVKTQKSVQVRINDRGPFWPGRVIDLSLAAARALGTEDSGLDPVRIEIVKLPDHVPPGVYTVEVGWFLSDDQLNQCHDRMASLSKTKIVGASSAEGKWIWYSGAPLTLDQGKSIVLDLRQHHFPAYLVREN